MENFIISLVYCLVSFLIYKIFYVIDHRMSDEDTRILLFGIFSINILMAILVNYKLATYVIGAISSLGFLWYLTSIFLDLRKLAK